MATYYSDHMADSDANTVVVTGFKAPVGIKHGRERTSVARCTGLFLTTDTVRMITLKSSDRLLSLQIASDGACTAGAVAVGVSFTGSAHDGVVDDFNLFAAGYSVVTEFDLSEIFDRIPGRNLAGVGKTMWEIVTLGIGTNYTEDPNLEFDITITPTTSLTDAATELTLKATYTAGD